MDQMIDWISCILLITICKRSRTLIPIPNFLYSPDPGMEKIIFFHHL